MPSLRGRRTLPEAGERHDLEALLAERRPVALGILDQLVGFRHPQGPAPALEPVVEDHARDLPALAGARAVAQEPAAAKPHRVRRPVRCGREIVEGLVHAPGAGEMARMGLAGADDAFELGVREQAGAEDALRQVRAVARLRRCDRGHRGGLHQPGRVRACAGDAHGLERVAFVQALAQATDLSGRSLAGLVDEFDNGRRGCARDGRLDGVKAGRDPRT